MDLNNSEMVLPRNEEAEKALISLAFLGSNGDDLFEAVSMVKPSDFYSTVNQQVWEAVSTLKLKGVGIDVVSVSDELKNQNLDPKSAIETILEAFDSPSVISGNLKRFAEAVHDSSVLRRLISALDVSSQEAKTNGATPKAVINELEKRLIGLTDEVLENRPHDMGGILAEVEVDIENTLRNGWKGMSTGFKGLDERTGGFIPTHVWIVGAYTGTGKTFLLLQFALSLLKQGKRVMLVSTEMDRKMNLLRLLGMLSGISPINIMRGQMDDYELSNLETAKCELQSYKDQLFIYDNVYTTYEIALKTKKLKLEHGLDVVMVDFIQNLQGAENIYERMSQASIDLQELSQQQNVCMVVASQVSQASASWGGKSEVIEYKGAGEIAAMADVGLWLMKIPKRDMEKKGLMDVKTRDGGLVTYRHLILRKVRHGEPAKITLRMDFPSGTVEQIEDPTYNEPVTNSALDGIEKGEGDDFEP